MVDKQGKKIDLETLVDEADGDIGFIDRWL
jgi:hypothetical protein